MASNVKSRVREFQRLLRKASLVGIKRAAIFYHAECRKAVNEPNTGQPRTRTRDTTGGAKGSQYTAYEQPSAPGEPPHKITGTGQSNIVQGTNENPNNPLARVGVAKAGIHMAYLELGTKTIQPRPWLGIDGVLGKHMTTIARLAATGGKDVIR